MSGGCRSHRVICWSPLQLFQPFHEESHFSPIYKFVLFPFGVPEFSMFKAEVSRRGTACESSSIGAFSLELCIALAVCHLLHGADGLCCEGCDSLSRFWYYLVGGGQEPMLPIAVTTKLTVHHFQVHE